MFTSSDSDRESDSALRDWAESDSLGQSRCWIWLSRSESELVTESWWLSYDRESQSWIWLFRTELVVSKQWSRFVCSVMKELLRELSHLFLKRCEFSQVQQHQVIISKELLHLNEISWKNKGGIKNNAYLSHSGCYPWRICLPLIINNWCDSITVTQGHVM